MLAMFRASTTAALLLLYTCQNAHALVNSADHLKPLTPTAIAEIPGISAPLAVSQSGAHVAFAVDRYVAADNNSTHNIMVLDTATDVVRDITAKMYGRSDSNPIWLDAHTLAYLSHREGGRTTQLWYKDIRVQGEEHQLTDFPVDISTVQYHADTQTLTFAARVYGPVGCMNETAARDEAETHRHDSAMAFDSLFVRHWDRFEDGKASSLFAVHLNRTQITGPGHEDVVLYSVKEWPVNLSTGGRLDTPIPPFGGLHDYTISPDAREVAFVAKDASFRNQSWSTRTYLYTATTCGSKAPVIVNSDNTGACSSPAYSHHAGGKYLAWLAMLEDGYEADRRQIMVRERTSGYTRKIAFHWDRSPASIFWGKGADNLNWLYASTEEHGRLKLFRIHVSAKLFNGNPVEVKDDRTHDHIEIVLNDHSNMAPTWLASSSLIFIRSASDSPAEVYTADTAEVPTPSITRRTHVTEEHVRDVGLQNVREYWFKGARGDQTMAWITLPIGFQQGKKYPLAFLIHGGPQGAWMDVFGLRWSPNIYASAGFVVMQVNFHGSTGYGQEFTDSIKNQWGGYPFEDLMLGLDAALAEFAFIDSTRIAALGASFGGYMINWINGNSHRFACLVNHDGIFSTVSAYYTTDELWFPEREFSGTPWEKRAAYEQWNPERFVEDWKTPTLVFHGAKDYRLVDGEGLATFTALQRRGIPSRLVYFPDENHWVLKPGNAIRWYSEALTWINKWTANKHEHKSLPAHSTSGSEIAPVLKVKFGGMRFKIQVDGALDMIQ